MDRTQRSENSAVTSPGKQKYTRPMLVTYGDIVNLTQATGNNGPTDSGTHALQKTS